MDLQLYHIHKPEHKGKLTEGYIGVSVDAVTRFKQHKRTTNSHLKNAFNKYPDLQMTVICFGDKNTILRMEEELRPSENIGWNIAKGGGLPPVLRMVGSDNPSYGKERTEEARRNTSVALQGIERSSSTRGKMGKNRKASHYKNKSTGKITTPDKVFDKTVEAAVYYSVSTAAIRWRIKSDLPQWSGWTREIN